MKVSELYHWIEDDPTHGLILRITDSEIDTLKQGKEAMQYIIGLYALYTNDQIYEVYDLIDKIIEVASDQNNPLR